MTSPPYTHTYSGVVWAALFHGLQNTTKDNLVVATWSNSILAPAAEQNLPLIFHNPSYVQAASALWLFPLLLIYAWAPNTLPANGPGVAPTEAADNECVPLLWVEPPLQLSGRTGEMSLCDSGYHSVSSVRPMENCCIAATEEQVPFLWSSSEIYCQWWIQLINYPAIWIWSRLSDSLADWMSSSPL